MNFDIIFVTYNSKKWLNGNLQSILKSDYDLKNRVSLIYYDNNSTDDTVDELNRIKKQYEGKFKKITIVNGKKNKGFGYGNNKAIQNGNSEYLFILNTDTEIYPDTLSNIAEEIKNSSTNVMAFELKQIPYEHPKYYDPITGYTSWASGACVVIKRSFFEKIGGFDKNLFMYCEDVDLSWNIRKNGGLIKYLYNVPIIHYSYTEPNQFKITQFVYGYVNNLYLRAKYGSLKNCCKGLILILKAIKNNYAYPKLSNKEYKRQVRPKIIKELIKMIPSYIYARLYKHLTKTSNNFKPKFINDLDYETSRINPFRNLINEEKTMLKDGPLISIIVRTCGRPQVLRENLISLRKQTYKNIEIIIVEDGKNISDKMINDEFSDLNIKYTATNERVGRCKVGNIALEKAKGKYINFLDDDDAFFPNHIERLISYAEKNNYDIVYDTAFETAIEIKSKDPYIYEIKRNAIVFNEKYSKFKLYNSNLFPIQTVMFRKELLKKTGMFDEKMDALEDWDFWIRLSFESNFHYIPDTTSVYRVPAVPKISADRQRFLDDAYNYVINKYSEQEVKFNFDDIKYFRK